jgi:hypothetical protein
MKKRSAVVDGAVSTRGDQLKERLYYVIALALFVLSLAGLVLKGRDAFAALTWGWEDILTPATTELKHGQQVNYGVYDFDRANYFLKLRESPLSTFLYLGCPPTRATRSSTRFSMPAREIDG